MNRTIIEKVRCMLSHACLPRSFWGEVMCAAIHVINLSPTAVLKGKVPEEVCSGKERSYKHLRVFGCKKINDINKSKNNKVDDDLIDFDSKDEKNNNDQPTYEINHEHYAQDQADVPLDVFHDNVQGDARDEGLNEDPPNTQGQQADINSSPSVRTSTRVRTASTRYPPRDYILLFEGGEPICYEEAVRSDDKDKWLQTMDEEMQSLYKNLTFKLVNKVPDSTVLKNKLIYKLKNVA
ncbi:hypothetical protein LIER_27449 [Lithospermum erythrorhizon]|uniref:Retrovirus-related Pol polyprotein from transposon TNT 1-94 n=1 Tax=Lithospermum erythrorhizon TaxID=34254 RepID=A0AAV3RC37_LITER